MLCQATIYLLEVFSSNFGQEIKFLFNSYSTLFQYLQDKAAVIYEAVL